MTDLTRMSFYPSPLAEGLAHEHGGIAGDAHGSNRAVGVRPQISARTDLQAITAWLARFTDSPHTFNSYRKEAERLMLWSERTVGKPVSSLTHEDMLAYQHFLKDPQPASLWIMPAGRKVSRSDPDWRPFAGPLSASSVRLAIIILNSMFSWLVTAGYLAGNPLSLSRQRSRRSAPRITRYLDEGIWSEVKCTIADLPQETERECAHAARLRWLFSLLYLTGLRISEAAENSMGGFFRRTDAQGRDRWWLEITGKGNKERIVPATSELMAELSRYRQHKGLAPFPLPNETDIPLVMPVGGQPRFLTRAAIHSMVKSVFKRTADRLRERGAEFAWQAQHVEQASAHWLRHTAGSHMANSNVDLRHVRDTLGHESLNTTNIYLHSNDDDRHTEIDTQHKAGW